MPQGAAWDAVARLREALCAAPYIALLLLLMAAILIEPLYRENAWLDLLLRMVQLTLVYGAAVASRAGALGRRFVVGLLLVKLAVDVAFQVSGGVEALALASTVISVAIGLTALVLTLRGLFVARASVADALAGAAFGYLLLAAVWAQLYFQIERASPGSFQLIEGGGAASEQLMYFSLVTLTTLGYGEIVANTPFTRLLTGFEAAQGALYLAIFIGRILAITQEQRGPESRA
jgi:hypothetical protein